jgi:hypothetical protein
MLFSPPEGPGGGIEKVDTVHPGESPVIYIEVEEIQPYLEKAKTLGGAVKAPKTEISTIGWFALLADPDNNTVGLFQGREQ